MLECTCEASLEKQPESVGIGWGGVDLGRGPHCSQQELPAGERRETLREQGQKTEHPSRGFQKHGQAEQIMVGGWSPSSHAFYKVSFGVGRDGEPCSLSRKW